MRVLNGEGNNSVEEEREEKKNSKRDKRNVQIKAYFSDSVLVLRNVRNARTPSVKSTSRDSLEKRVPELPRLACNSNYYQLEKKKEEKGMEVLTI
ncbi:hypothetical protein OUZ56_004597 [Daphnia magna]|uniref:Uncharacterized protein n=1 Tax=Daphnia magna TaxID=35525 RepID=A0ABQ9YQC5_9CRUS|nr:hypothetical protein OUZ56_004597 [Daphnia magna]